MDPLQLAHPVGALVDGTVVWRGAEGAVVKLPDGYSGWLAEVEVSWSRDREQSAKLATLGSPIQLRVIGHNLRRRQVMLSLRQVAGHPLDQIDAVQLVGTVQAGVVASAVHYGLFVRLPIGFDGLLHRSKLEPGQWPSLGEPIAVRVMGVEAERRAVALERAEPSSVGIR